MMRDSLIIITLLSVIKKLLFYYKSSRTSKILQELGQVFRRYAAGSCILSFFDREWNIASAWKKSFVFRAMILPLKFYRYTSEKLCCGANSALEGSRLLCGMKLFLENMYVMSTRVYGLFFLTFAVTHGLLDLVSGSGEFLLDMKGMARLALLFVGAVLILVNRPVRLLVENSITGRLAYDFFTVSEGPLSYETSIQPKKGTISYKTMEAAAAAAGLLSGAAGYLLPPMAFVMAAGAIAGMVLVLWRYEIGVYAVVGFIPLAPTMALLGLILLTVLSYGIRLFRDKSMSFRVTVLDYFVVLFGVVLLFSTVTSYTPGKSMLVLMIHAAFILFYFILVNTVKTRQQLYTLIVLLVLATTVASLYGLYQLRTVGATSEAWVDTTLFEDIKARVGSTFENPNVLGEYLVLVIPVAIAMLWGQKSWLSRLLTLALTAVMLLCLVYTYSRGAYVGLMLAFALFAVLRDRRFVILGVIGLMLLPFVLPPSVINRFASIGNLSDTSSSYRISVWLGSLRMAIDYWASGIGLGLEPFKLIYPKYSLNAAYAHHSHNIYIQLMIEMGIAGFVLFLAIIAVYYKTLLAGFYKTRDSFVSTIMIALASGMAGYLAQGMVENIWYNNRVLLTFWVMLAFGMISKALISRDNEVLEL